MVTSTGNPFAGWAILELMGHKRLAGYVTEVEFAGSAMIRIDVPGDEDGDTATQLYNSSAMYCLTPTDEATARAVAKTCTMAPVTRWEIEAPARRAAAIEAANRDADDEGVWLRPDDLDDDAHSEDL